MTIKNAAPYVGRDAFDGVAKRRASESLCELCGAVVYRILRFLRYATACSGFTATASTGARTDSHCASNCPATCSHE
jgi:ferredoxin